MLHTSAEVPSIDDDVYASLRYSCNHPYSKEGYDTILRLAPQTLRTNSQNELKRTCECISYIIISTTPANQKQCINLLDAFPWNNVHGLKLIDTSAPLHSLQHAIDSELPEVVKYLVKKRGINIDTLSANTNEAPGRTALMWAVIRKQTAMVELLLELGADPFITTSVGKRAIDYFDKRCMPEEIYRLLDKKEAEINPQLAYARRLASDQAGGYTHINSNRLGSLFSFNKKSEKRGYSKVPTEEPDGASTFSFSFGKRKKE